MDKPTLYVMCGLPFSGKTTLGMKIADHLNAQMIAREVPDFLNKIYYISGPHGMVNAFEETLKSMGVPNKNIKIDFFPGFA